MYPSCHLCAALHLARTACWASSVLAESGCKRASSSEAHSSFQGLHLLGSALLPPPAALLLYSVNTGPHGVKHKYRADWEGWDTKINMSLPRACVYPDVDLLKCVLCRKSMSAWKQISKRKTRSWRRYPAHAQYIEHLNWLITSGWCSPYCPLYRPSLDMQLMHVEGNGSYQIRNTVQ